MLLLSELPVVNVFEYERRRYPAIYREVSSSEQHSEFRLDRKFLEQLVEVSDTSTFQKSEQNYLKLLDELLELGDLDAGWDTYEAEPPNQVALDNARMSLTTLRKLSAEPAGIRPSGDGGVAICFTRNKKYAHFEFSNDGDFCALTFGPAEEAQSWLVANLEDEFAKAWERIHAFLQS